MDTVYLVRPPARYPEENYVVSARSTYEAALRDVRDWLVRERDGRVGRYERPCMVEHYVGGERVERTPVRTVESVDDALARIGARPLRLPPAVREIARAARRARDADV